MCLRRRASARVCTVCRRSVSVRASERVCVVVGGRVGLCARAGACVVCAVQCDGLAPAAAARWRRDSPAQAAACSNESTTSPRLPLASESSFGSLSPARMVPHPARTVTITVRSRSADIRIECSAVSASAAVTCGGPLAEDFAWPATRWSSRRRPSGINK